MTQTATAKAIAEQQAHHERRAAMRGLLHRLRKWMAVFPHKVNADMPDHDVVWTTHVGGDGPEKAILDAIAANPSMWLHALPEEVCIVPRKDLERALSSKNAVDYIATLGSHFTARLAEIKRCEMEEVERMRFYERHGAE